VASPLQSIATIDPAVLYVEMLCDGRGAAMIRAITVFKREPRVAVDV